jgi:hypothetical protein
MIDAVLLLSNILYHQRNISNSNIKIPLKPELPITHPAACDDVSDDSFWPLCPDLCQMMCQMMRQSTFCCMLCTGDFDALAWSWCHNASTIVHLSAGGQATVHHGMVHDSWTFIIPI